MAQLMPLPLTVSCFSKIQIGFTFLVTAHLGSPGKGPLNGCVVSELGGPRVHGAPHSVSALQNPYIMTRIFMKVCWHENFMDIYTETFAKGKMLRW